MRKLLPPHARLKIKQPCPICGGQLTVKCNDFMEEAENGDWVATSIEAKCGTEPDPETDEWIAWQNKHYLNPYIDLIEQKVLPEFQRKFRFDV